MGGRRAMAYPRPMAKGTARRAPKGGRVTAKGTQPDKGIASGRYTPPDSPRGQDQPALGADRDVHLPGRRHADDRPQLREPAARSAPQRLPARRPPGGSRSASSPQPSTTDVPRRRATPTWGTASYIRVNLPRFVHRLGETSPPFTRRTAGPPAPSRPCSGAGLRAGRRPRWSSASLRRTRCTGSAG